MKELTLMCTTEHDTRTDTLPSPKRCPGVVSVDPFVTETEAHLLRVGKQLLSPDGWQTIIGLLVSQDTNQVVVWTGERPDDDTPGAEGWQFHFGDPVHTRLVPTAEQEYQRKRRERMARRQARRLAMDAAHCPSWCIEHYDGQDDTGAHGRNHAGDTHTVMSASVYSGEPYELGFWLERRDDKATGTAETVGVLEVRLCKEDIELTPANLRLLASRLNSLADIAELHR
jgi:hypothetical protein